MSKKLLLLGGGGHCKSVLDSLILGGDYRQIGIIDLKDRVGDTVLGVPIIGCDEDLPKLFQQGFSKGFVTLGSIGNPANRVRLFEHLVRLGFEIPTVVDPTAVVSQHARLGRGVFVGKNAVINGGANIGTCSIINTLALVEHDCIVGDYVHVATGAVLCGEVHVGSNTHIGASSVVKQLIRIGSNSLIGMGSVVLQNVADNTVAYGNPCKEAKKS